MPKRVKRTHDSGHIVPTSGLSEEVLWEEERQRLRQDQSNGTSDKGKGMHTDRTSSGLLSILLLASAIFGVRTGLCCKEVDGPVA